MLVLAAGTVVAAVALGSGDDREVTDLRPALLTLDDLGNEFSPASDDDEDDTLDLDEADMDEDCREALERFAAGGEDDEDESLMAAFERRSDGVGVEHELDIIDADEPTLGEVADALGQCDRIAYEDQGVPVELRLSVSDVEGLGEEALALDLTIDVTVMAGAQVTAEAYGLMVVRDGTASTVFVTGPLDPATLEAGPVDRDLARELAGTADGRVQQALD